ncbi:T9SS type A sorting domain-containing protein, partial [candidate division KSB1 bacterium]|nr:T9SS type A sorting domain-containing protein [candidate division KSB1 bacterium]
TVVGDSSGKGIILRSYDGGINWVVQNRTPSCIFEDVFFTHPDSGFVVGSAGNVWRTTNGGTSWAKVTNIPPNPQFYNFYGIHFINSKVGTIVGSSGAIWRTTNGGQSWTAQTNPFSMAPLQSVYFTHPDSGIAVGYFGAVLRTTDGGTTWGKLANIPVPFNTILTSVSFADADTGVIVGQNATVLRSTDKGANWKLMTLSGLTEAPLLEYVHFVDNRIGYIVGAKGYVFRTEDGGLTWSKQLRTTSRSLNAISFIDPYIGMAVGDQGTILRTYDGGLPVELTAFSGFYDLSRHTVILSWQTVSETNNYGFEVQKATHSGWSKIGFVRGHGTTVEPQSYEFRDPQPGNGNHEGSARYRLKQLDLDGTFSYSPVIEIKISHSVDSYALEQNYPNPFNNSTTIAFSMATANRVRLQIFNALGQLVDTLVDGELPAGQHAVIWRASGRAGGVYFVQLSTAGMQRTKKLLYLP